MTSAEDPEGSTQKTLPLAVNVNMSKVRSSATSTAAAEVLQPLHTRQNKRNELEGIELTDPLRDLLQKAFDTLPTLQQLSLNNVDRDEKDNAEKMNDDCDKYAENTDHNINILIEQMMALSRTTHLPSMEEAVSLLQQQQQISKNQTKLSYISIPVLRAMETIFDDCDKKSGNRSLSIEFENALEQQAINLVYTNSLPSEKDNEEDDSIESILKNSQHLSKEQRKFQLRMRQLRLQNEERKYMKITNNVHTFKMNDDDAITTKSMTYAASIGLNMIVAPITFGVFMYFFAGSLLDYFWPTSHHSTAAATTVDVKKVIAGVISGVIMLFIEMILFVIRTHEMDKAMVQKRKKKGHITSLSPFGYYKSTTTKTYVDH